MFRSNVLVCGGTGCTSSNSLQIAERLKEEIKAKGLDKEVNVITTGCFGLCALGPIMVVYPEGSSIPWSRSMTFPRSWKSTS